MTTKVLLDTDIGSDIDDAVALAYLLAQPECDLIGVTTVTGEAVKRASMASAICKVAGRDVPIYPGAEQPYAVEQKQPTAPQAVALPRWAHETDFPEGEAVDFLRRTIHQNPGEVVLLAIGPLTNVARLLQADPDVAHLLKALVLMGGVYLQTDKAEWNLMLDPQAAEIVYGARFRLHRSIGLDVTTQVVLPTDEVRTRFSAPLLKPVLDFAEVWFAGVPRLTFHDPLAAATIFEPSLCGYEAGEVTIDTVTLPGESRFVVGSDGSPHEIAVSVDVPRYFAHFFGVLNGSA